jgi:hypothetical protein
MKFKVGDRIKYRGYVGHSGEYYNQIGTIIYVGAKDYCVEFDNHIDGHTGNDPEVRGREGHCWWIMKISEDEMQKIELAEKQIKVYGIVKFLASIEKGS